MPFRKEIEQRKSVGRLSANYLWILYGTMEDENGKGHEKSEEENVVVEDKCEKSSLSFLTNESFFSS